METAHLALSNDNINDSLTLPAAPFHALQSRQLTPSAIAYAFTEPALVFFVVGLVTVPCLACIALARIFRRILDNIVTLWASSPPSNQVVIEAGSVRIEFGCAVEPVMVAFIEVFAAHHLDAVERGFAPAFAREWWWVEREGSRRICYAGLRVVEGDGVAIPPFG